MDLDAKNTRFLTFKAKRKRYKAKMEDFYGTERRSCAQEKRTGCMNDKAGKRSEIVLGVDHKHWSTIEPPQPHTGALLLKMIDTPEQGRCPHPNWPVVACTRNNNNTPSSVHVWNNAQRRIVNTLLHHHHHHDFPARWNRKRKPKHGLARLLITPLKLLIVCTLLLFALPWWARYDKGDHDLSENCVPFYPQTAEIYRKTRTIFPSVRRKTLQCRPATSILFDGWARDN